MRSNAGFRALLRADSPAPARRDNPGACATDCRSRPASGPDVVSAPLRVSERVALRERHRSPCQQDDRTQSAVGAPTRIMHRPVIHQSIVAYELCRASVRHRNPAFLLEQLSVTTSRATIDRRIKSISCRYFRRGFIVRIVAPILSVNRRHSAPATAFAQVLEEVVVTARAARNRAPGHADLHRRTVGRNTRAQGHRGALRRRAVHAQSVHQRLARLRQQSADVLDSRHLGRRRRRPASVASRCISTASMCREPAARCSRCSTSNASRCCAARRARSSGATAPAAPSAS